MVNKRAELQNLLEIKVASELGIYLGVPITYTETLRSRIAAKLNGWRAKTLGADLLAELFASTYAISLLSTLPDTAGTANLGQC